MSQAYFVPPATDIFTNSDDEYLPGYATYSSYNYLGNSLIAKVKRRHFEVALALTRFQFGSGVAVDMGCADGFLLPSLSRYFAQVYGVDNSRTFVEQAQQIVQDLHLDNVEVLCNAELSWDELVARIPVTRCRVIYLLETLEHIGVARRLYESKIDFLQELSRLLAPDGVIAISVPVMVGLPFLLQRIALHVFQLQREPMTARQLFRAVVRRDATEFESTWTSTAHLGFNHVKLERYMRKSTFDVIAKRNLGLTMVYLLRPKR